jgi:hypothetical protein
MIQLFIYERNGDNMITNDFNYYDPTKALELVLTLNILIDQEVDGVEEIETALFNLFGTTIKIRLHEVITPDEGPIYHYVTEISELPVSIYVTDWFDAQLIVAVNSGVQATYINENIKNVIKGTVI